MTERMVLETSSIFGIQLIMMMSELFCRIIDLWIINMTVKDTEWDQP